MSPRATPCTEPAATRTWRTLLRHQLGSIVASIVDFSTMIALVELLATPPTAATALGASMGGVTNFSLGRFWIFRRHRGGIAGQGLRYALVSAASAMLNAGGEHLLHDLARVQYVAARFVVAATVSLVWNFPLQRRFVFREGCAA
jgi:putative flippase GtrA